MIMSGSYDNSVGHVNITPDLSAITLSLQVSHFL